MILAAGMGTRLRPLTREMPKALLPVGNRPQIEFVLEMLLRAGVRKAVINLHHLGDALRAALGPRYRGSLELSYSDEPELLGTGGGLRKVEGFFGEEPFFLINADTLVDVDLATVAHAHAARGAVATMVVRNWEEGAPFGRVEMDGEGWIRRVLGRGAGSGLTPVIFTGIHVLDRRVFAYIPPKAFSCINRECYGAMLEAGERVFGFNARGYWRDIGTLRDYFDANMDCLRGVMPRLCGDGPGKSGEISGRGGFPGVEFVAPVIVGRGCEIGAGSRIGPSVVLGEGSRAGEGCRLERVVALPRSRFAAGETLRGCIRSPGALVRISG